MSIEVVPFLSFVLVTTFTPGPNNISSASMGVLHGYKKTVKYCLGIATGFFGVMLLCGLISNTLLHILPGVETPLRIAGAGYILWLAFETLHTSYTFEDTDRRPLGFARGVLLQVLNLKAIVYGLTLYSTFLSPITDNLTLLISFTLFLTCMSFCSTSTWALFGASIRTYLHQPKIRQGVNLVLALLLVYTAIELSGLLPVIQRMLGNRA